MNSAARFGGVLFFLFALPLLCGCVTPVPQSRIDLSLTKEIPKNETPVFGRVKVVRDKKILSWKPEPKVVSIGIYRFLPEFFTVFVKDEATKKEFAYRLAGDGSFLWHLPAGTYSITGYHYNRGPTYVESHFPSGLTPGFVVFKGDPAVYIGTLSIDVHPMGSDPMEIVDEYDRAQQDLKREFPGPGSGAEKRLMAFH